MVSAGGSVWRDKAELVGKWIESVQVVYEDGAEKVDEETCYGSSQQSVSGCIG